MTGTGIDVGVAILILISAILAAARGFTRELLSLATWAGSAAIAVYLYFNRPETLDPKVADKTINPVEQVALQLHHLAQSIVSDPTFAMIGLIAAVFLVMLIILHLLTMWIADLIVDSRIGPLDRSLGFIFGAARGLLICIVGAVFLEFLMPNQEVLTKETHFYNPLLSMGHWIEAKLPPDLAQMLTGIVNKTDPNNPNPKDTVPPPTGDLSTSVPPVQG